jgi:predicted transcriptional regulator
LNGYELIKKFKKMAQKMKKEISEDMGLITAEALSYQLNISRTSLWRLEKSGKLKRAGNLGRRVYYKIGEVLESLINQ